MPIVPRVQPGGEGWVAPHVPRGTSDGWLEDLRAPGLGQLVRPGSRVRTSSIERAALNYSLATSDLARGRARIQTRRRGGLPLRQALEQAGVTRFRAIVLTSVTKFACLSPLVMDPTTQAQILVPMAVSLAYDIIVATLITLILIPVQFLILRDLWDGLRR